MRSKKIRMITLNIHKELFENVKIAMEKEYFQNNLVERMWLLAAINQIFLRSEILLVLVGVKNQANSY